MERDKRNTVLGSVMLSVYMIASSPVALFAQSVENRKIESERIMPRAASAASYAASDNGAQEGMLVASAMIGPEGGTVGLDEIRIEIPSGALDGEREIQILTLEGTEHVGDEITNATGRARGYRFLPHGTQFARAAKIYMPYNPELNSSPAKLRTLATYFYDTDEKCWTRLSRVGIDTKNCVIISETTHFTDMINATLALPENASPLESNLNSIKDLEAVNPAAGLAGLRGFEKSSGGDVSFSLEFPVTGGRRGMVPSVSVSYSSDGSSGLLGKGFYMSCGGAITTDTRFGLPNYDGNDRYMYNGRLLEKNAGRSNEKYDVYETKIKGSHEKIFAYRGDGISNYDYWVVMAKNGVKSFYGKDEGSWNGTRVDAGDGKKLKGKFSWHMTQTADRRGNSVNYSYENDGNNVYLKTVSYTGNSKKSEEGNWRIKFFYDSNRKDVRTDARGKFLSESKRRLSSISSYYGDTADSGGTDNFLKMMKFTYADENELYNSSMVSYLKKIEMFSAGDNLNRDWAYEFEYNDLGKEDGEYVYFGEQTKVEGTENIPLFVNNSTSSGGSGNFGGGLGVGKSFWDIRTTAGGNFSSSDSDSYASSVLVDINGDGKADSVTQKGNSLYVRLNNGNGFDTESKEIIFNGSSFSYALEEEEGKSHSNSLNVYGGLGFKGETEEKDGGANLDAGVVFNKTWTYVDTSLKCTFTDMNRDGLVDIVEAGKDYWFRNTGDLRFEKTDFYDLRITDVTLEISATRKKGYEDMYYKQTPFKMWRSPYRGNLRIENTITPDSSDNVMAYIYFGNSKTPVENTVANKSTLKNSVGKEVSDGDEIFFIHERVSTEDENNNDVNWNIKISYDSINVFSTRHLPLFVPEKEEYTIQSVHYLNELKSKCKSGRDEEQQEAIKTYENAKNLFEAMTEYNKKFGSLYDSIGNDDNSTTYKINPERIFDYKKNHDALNNLVRENRFIPAVINKAAYKELPDEGKGYYIYDIYKDVFFFDKNVADVKYSEEEYSFEGLAAVYNALDIKNSSLDIYKVYGMVPEFGENGLSYASEKEFLISERTSGGTGTVEDGNVYLGNYLGKSLYYGDSSDGKKKVIRSADGSFEKDNISSVEGSYVFDEEKYTVAYSFGKKESGPEEYVFEKEFEAYNDKKKPGNNGEDIKTYFDEKGKGYYKLKEESKSKYNYANCKYHSIEKYVNEISKKKSEISGKKETLDEYQEIKKYIDSLEKDQDPDMEKLKELTGDDIAEKIAYLNNGLADLPEEISKLGEEISKLGEEKAGLEVKICLDKFFKEIDNARFSSVRICIRYKADSLYALDDKKVEMASLEDNGIVNKKKPAESADAFGSSLILSFDSARDFSAEDSSDGLDESYLTNNILYGGYHNWFYGIWKGNVKGDAKSEGGFDPALLSLDELAKLDEVLVKEYDITKEKARDFNKNRNELKDKAASKVASVKENSSELPASGNPLKDSGRRNEIKWILPVKADIKNLDKLIVEGENSREISGEEIKFLEEEKKDGMIHGPISFDVLSCIGWNSSGERERKNVQVSYTPFIKGDRIHVSRLGGLQYFKLVNPKGVAMNGMPSLRKSFNDNDGDDWSAGPSFGLGISDSKLKDDGGRTIPTKSYSAGLNFATGESNTTSWTSTGTVFRILFHQEVMTEMLNAITDS